MVLFIRSIGVIIVFFNDFKRVVCYVNLYRLLGVRSILYMIVKYLVINVWYLVV